MHLTDQRMRAVGIPRRLAGGYTRQRTRGRSVIRLECGTRTWIGSGSPSVRPSRTAADRCASTEPSDDTGLLDRELAQ